MLDWMPFASAEGALGSANRPAYEALKQIYSAMPQRQRRQLRVASARYGFGSVMLGGGKAFSPDGSELPADAVHPQIGVPFAVVTRNKFEVVDKEPFVPGADDFREHPRSRDEVPFHFGMSEAVLAPGSFIGLFETLDFALEARGPSRPHWTIAAGALNFYPANLRLPLRQEDFDVLRNTLKHKDRAFDASVYPHEFACKLREPDILSWSAEVLFLHPAWCDALQRLSTDATKADRVVGGLHHLVKSGWSAQAKVRTAGPSLVDAFHDWGSFTSIDALYACASLLELCTEVLDGRRPCFAPAESDELGPFSVFRDAILSPTECLPHILVPAYLQSAKVGYLPLSSISSRFLMENVGKNLQELADGISRATGRRTTDTGGRMARRSIPLLNDSEIFKRVHMRIPSFSDVKSKKGDAGGANVMVVQLRPELSSPVQQTLTEEQFFAPHFPPSFAMSQRGFFKFCVRFEVLTDPNG